jgi:hypothetical protein
MCVQRSETLLTFLMSHTFRDPSCEPVISSSPLELKHKLLTASFECFNTANYLRVFAQKSAAVPFSRPQAMNEVVE